jgi:hypothetical protein
MRQSILVFFAGILLGSLAMARGLDTGGPLENMTASPLSGTPPLAVTFDIEVSGTFTLDFGDGSTPATIIADCSVTTNGICATATHTYVSEGMIQATLSPGSGDNSVVLAIGGTQAAPLLTSIAPSSVHAGDTVTLSGSGFIAFADMVIFDLGQFGFNIVPTTDNLATFAIPSGMSPGAHSLILRNSNGMSSSLSFTVVP